MPVEKIIERIEKDAQRKVDNILAREEEKAEELKEEIEREKERRLDEIRKKKEREIKTLKNRILSQAKLEARKKKLNVREEMMEKVFENAKNELGDTDPSEYKDYLKNAVEKSTDVLGEDITIYCNEKSESIVRDIVENINPSVELENSLDSIGGIKASSEKGAEIDLTFEANMKRIKKDLRKEISDILFAED
ncbi:MAG: V-type ATP synthase subunit E [Thermoplasmatota archaeon]